jgi:signal transduction histidine kinase
MKKLSIKLKLIGLFIILKVVPLVMILFLSLQGIEKLNKFFIDSSNDIFKQNNALLKDSTDIIISDSIKSLDKKSQDSIQKLTIALASKVANLLKSVDDDILFLSKLNIDQNILKNFYDTKNIKQQVDPKFKYDDKLKKWIQTQTYEVIEPTNIKINKDNKNEFNIRKIKQYKTKLFPKYKEVSFFDLNGIEKYKVSQIDSKKLDIKIKQNTYINSEDYYNEIKNLKNGEIYVSDVIGEYVKSNIIGIYNKDKTDKLNKEFSPQKSAYAGLENPVGKRFEGIIRFITPVFKNNKKIGYISLALDHYHIMELTDRFHPINDDLKRDISSAIDGNYAFMWDYKGRNISHPRDYFIVGFDKKTGKRVPGWISADLAKQYEQSSYKSLDEFLKTVPEFDNQTLSKKPNLKQLKVDGSIALDCRYLNFAPQCEGWMQLTKDGGSGSFIIYWSKLWKLSTAASIPYYTGKYANSKRGFGFVTIGANVEEFHSAALENKKIIQNSLKTQSKNMENILEQDRTKIEQYVDSLLNQLSSYTIVMIIIVIFIAILLSNYLTDKLNKLRVAAKNFADGKLDYRLEITDQEEIAQLETSLNSMAQNIKQNQIKLKEKDRIMYQQAKMASMGEMLENIAHQWRQPLSVISSEASGIKVKKEFDILDEEELLNTMDNITQTTQHLSNTIDDFRNFFKPQIEKEIFNIESSIEKTLNIIGKKLANRDFIVIKNVGKNLKVDGFESELVQVFMNIISNTIDATVLKDIQQRYLFIDIFEDNNNNVVITIKDSAGGIPKDIINKIFDPYFTTKHKSNGTGIGLYMSEEIIVKHFYGEIIAQNITYEYENQELIGVEFKIILPLVD